MAATVFWPKPQDDHLDFTWKSDGPESFRHYRNLTIGGCEVMICALPYGVLSCLMLKSPYVYVPLIFCIVSTSVDPPIDPSWLYRSKT